VPNSKAYSPKDGIFLFEKFPVVKLLYYTSKAVFICGKFFTKLLTGVSVLRIDAGLKIIVEGRGIRLGSCILDGDYLWVVICEIEIPNTIMIAGMIASLKIAFLFLL